MTLSRPRLSQPHSKKSTVDPIAGWQVATRHPHPLEKKEEAGGNWGCDGCGKSGAQCSERHRCTKGCDFDLCGDCNAKARLMSYYGCRDREASVVRRLSVGVGEESVKSWCRRRVGGASVKLWWSVGEMSVKRR